MDFSTKLLIVNYLKPCEVQVIISDFFNLTRIHNYGAIFGFMSQPYTKFNSVIFIFSGLVGILYFGLQFLDKKQKTINRISIAFILSGILGNTINRLQYNFVIDFLDFVFYGWHYWTFNLADIFIIIGILILIFNTKFD